MTTLAKPRRLAFEALEGRILFSASLAPAPVPEIGDAQEAESFLVQEQSAAPEAAVSPGEVQNPISENPTPFANSPDEQLIQKLANTSEANGAENEITDVTLAEVETIAQAASQIWIQSGINQQQIERLSQITYQVQDSGSTLIATSVSRLVYIDTNAALSGWFIDPTPLLNEEFAPAGSPNLLIGESGGAESKTDLLTAILHIQGRILGSTEDLDSPDVMNGVLKEGERLLPRPGQMPDVTEWTDYDPSYLGATKHYLKSDGIVVLSAPTIPGLALDATGAPVIKQGNSYTETPYLVHGTLENTTRQPLTVELFQTGIPLNADTPYSDETYWPIDSVALEPGVTEFTLTIDISNGAAKKWKSGTYQDFTILAYNSLNPYDRHAINGVSDSQVFRVYLEKPFVPESIPVATLPEYFGTTQGTPDSPPSFIVILNPAEAASGTLTVAFDPPLSFLDQLAGSAILSHELFGDPAFFLYNDLQLIEIELIGDSLYPRLAVLGSFGGSSPVDIFTELSALFDSLGIVPIGITPGGDGSHLISAEFLGGSLIPPSPLPTNPALPDGDG